VKQQLKSAGLTLVFAGLFLSLLIGGQFFFQNYYVADHFQEQLLKIDGIKSVQIGDEDITITMDVVSNIKESYQQIDKIISSKNYQIIIKDNPSQQLKEVAAESETAIQEAMTRGNFTEMEHYIKNMAQRQGIETKIFVDSQRVFLQFKSKDKFLYRILERPNSGLPTLGE